MVIACYQCSGELEYESEDFIPRTEGCFHCGAAIHSCRMCKFYDKSCYNECREPSAERVTDKEKANFCDYFKLLSNRIAEKNDNKSLLDEANRLFKD